MAGETRTATFDLSLYRSLAEAPYRFDFFQALRRIECLHKGKPRIGETVRLADDAIRLGQEPTMAFAPSTLKSFDMGSAGRPPRLKVLFFGMLGPNGPLPLHLTEFARSRKAYENDTTFVRFLDVFHHRLLSLFYRAWATAQPTVSFDPLIPRTVAEPKGDGFAISGVKSFVPMGDRAQHFLQ